MRTDDVILKAVDDAFGVVQRPRKFTVEDGDPECMDHDRLLHSRTPETLSFDDVGNLGYSPLTECLPEGIAYFFPALARFALTDGREFETFPFALSLRLISHGAANDFLAYCSSSQRQAVHSLFSHIKESRAEQIGDIWCGEEISECIALWAKSDAQGLERKLPMFGFFKSRKYSDIDFGELSLEKGYWRGVIVLDPCGEIPLAITGNKDGPDAQALAEAYRLRSDFPEWRPIIAQVLFDHLEPYAQAIEAGEYPEAPERVKHIKSPGAALSSAKLQFITVDRIGGAMMTELGYDTEWDEEHMLGIRFQDGKLIELCGSILRA